MSDSPDNPPPLPDVNVLREAIGIYLKCAYPQGVPPAAERFMPPADADAGAWLMGDQVERAEPDASLQGVRSFALRIGNALYPHMKLRLSRAGDTGPYLLSVDSHDTFLCAPPGSPDRAELEALKRHNAAVASAAADAMDAAGLPTERNFLRERIRRATRNRGGER